MVMCSPDVLDKPPPVGTTITVKHSGSFSGGLLKRPIFWRIKEDFPAYTPNEVIFYDPSDFSVVIKMEKDREP